MARLEGATITREQFLLREMRVACQLREGGLEDDALVNKIASENLIQYPTERMVKNIARVCVKRMNAVGSSLIVHTIATGETPADAQANLYAMMCTYPLVRDFMVHEVGSRYAQLDYQLGRAEVGAYLTNLQLQYENMAKLSDLSLEKINQVLRRCLVECGMLQGPRSSTLQPIFLDADVRMAIVGKGDDQALAAFGDLGAI
jgi:hypothetical protein